MALSAIRRRILLAAGGGARARVIGLLACLLALETADTSAIGASAGELQRALNLSHTDVGLLATSGLGVAALFALPIGWLVDRVHRVRLLVASIVLWSLGLVAVGASSSFAMLLATRLAVGAIAGTAWPAVASLTGDFFAPSERSSVYGLILAGELLGTGTGFLVSGNLAMALSWRFAFWVLAPPGIALALVLLRSLPEPDRGGAGRLPVTTDPRASRGTTPGPPIDDEVAARPGLVLRHDPIRMPFMRAARYVLRVPTNRVLILASTVAYFFQAGERTFGLEFVRSHFGLSPGTAMSLLVLLGIGALVGVLSGGRIADRLIRHGHATGRVTVGGLGYLAAAMLLLPGIAVPVLGLAAPALLAGTAALRAAVPPLDAARLDIMHHRLWGRAEGVRTLVRTALQAVAPVTFGLTADAFGGTGVGAGLEDAFLVMLAPLAVSGVIVLLAVRTYPRDVATAVASEKATDSGRRRAPSSARLRRRSASLTGQR